MQSEREERRAKIARLSAELAELLGAGILDEAQPGEEMTFAAIEARAHEAGKQVARWATKQAVQSHGERFDGLQACPNCGRLCRVEARKRTILTVDGPVELTEPGCHCPTCRRDFFPAAGALEVGSERIQPGSAGEGRGVGG
jgi:hypothetical protein